MTVATVIIVIYMGDVRYNSGSPLSSNILVLSTGRYSVMLELLGGIFIQLFSCLSS